MVATRELNGGHTLIVDEADLPVVESFCWFAHVTSGNDGPYAEAWIPDPDLRARRRRVYLHRYLLSAPAGMQVDHINGNRLDNRRENLRLCSARENRRNRKVNSNNKSGVSGVCWRRRWQRWHVRAGGVHIGVFKLLEDAIAARRTAEIERFGAFAPHLCRQGVA